MTKRKNKNAQALGAKGGKSTHKTYGSKYMAEIGRKGALKMWEMKKKVLATA